MSAGAHQRGHFQEDIEKYNSAALLGWIVLRFTHDDVTGEPFAMIDSVRKAVQSRQPTVPMIENLIPKEVDILYLIAAGYASEEIARRVGLGDNTVRNYVRSASQKLCTRTRAGSVARAIVWGLIDPARIPFPDTVEIDLPGKQKPGADSPAPAG
jgi:DNA-binding CsgD family transcriptional regulator